MLTVADARKIRDRVLAGWDQAEPVLAAYAAEHDYGQWWQLTMGAVLRLALAVREADGKLLVDDAVLDVLPRFAGGAAEILRRAGLLDPACDRLPGRRGSRHRVGPGPRSCQTCGAWGTRRRCEACQAEVPHRSRTGDPIGFSWKGTGTGAGKRKKIYS